MDDRWSGLGFWVPRARRRIYARQGHAGEAGRVDREGERVKERERGETLFPYIYIYTYILDISALSATVAFLRGHRARVRASGKRTNAQHATKMKTQTWPRPSLWHGPKENPIKPPRAAPDATLFYPAVQRACSIFIFFIRWEKKDFSSPPRSPMHVLLLYADVFEKFHALPTHVYII